MEKFFIAIDAATRAIVVLLGAFLVVIVFLEVLSRYLFESSLLFSNELARYTFIWISFLSAAPALLRGQHIGLDLDFLSRFVWLRMIAHLCTAGFLIVLLWTSTELLPAMWDQHTSSLGVRLFWAYLAIPVGALLMLLQIVAILSGYAEKIVAPERQD